MKAQTVHSDTIRQIDLRLIENDAYIAALKLSPNQMLSVVPLLALVPGEEGLAVQSGLVHAAAELADSLAVELIRLFEAYKHPSTEVILQRELADAGDYGA